MPRSLYRPRRAILCPRCGAWWSRRDLRLTMAPAVAERVRTGVGCPECVDPSGDLLPRPHVSHERAARGALLRELHDLLGPDPADMRGVED